MLYCLIPLPLSCFPVSLLHQFFKFYSEFDYKKRVVSIKHGRDRLLTRPEAVQEIKECDGDFNPRYFESQMVVQDPFELSHNVSKLVKSGTLERWCGGVARACCVLEQWRSRAVALDPPSILALFDVPVKREEGPGGVVRRSDWSVPLVFSVQRVQGLLGQGGTAALAQRLAELDLSSVSVRQNIGQLVLRYWYALASKKFCQHTY